MIYYDPSRTNPPSNLSYEDLADPKYKGKVVIRKSNNVYNQSLVASLIANNGKKKTANWAKGLDKVLNIGKHYYNRNKEFKLILIKPKYCEWEPELHEYPFIEKRGCIKNNNEKNRTINNLIIYNFLNIFLFFIC